MSRTIRRVPRQKNQIHDDFKKGWRGSAITYFDQTQRDPDRVCVSPSSFKRVVHELRQEYGRHYILDDRQPTVNPYGTPFCVYYMNPEIRAQYAAEGPTVEQEPEPEPTPATPFPRSMETIEKYRQTDLFSSDTTEANAEMVGRQDAEILGDDYEIGNK